MREILVDLQERSYPIYLESGALERLGELYNKHKLGERAAIVTDRTVEKLYARRVLQALREAGIDAQVIPVPPGESSKSLEWADRLYTRLIWGGFDREAVIVAVGGGVVGDLTGFVAATYLRGIRWVQVPTTLLAQVDASVGGKTGINHRLGKNLIGAFHQPRFVLIDPQALETLPERERRSGTAEVIKAGLIRDEALFMLLEQHLEELIRLQDPRLVEEVIGRAVAIKAHIVSEDEREVTGTRALLNFGHTVGHALEAATQYQHLTHGEAVLWGMLAEAHLSHRLKKLSHEELLRIQELVGRVPRPPLPEGLDIDTLMEYMYRDKKARGRRLRVVVLGGIGQAEVTEAPEKELREALQALGSSWS